MSDSLHPADHERTSISVRRRVFPLELSVVVDEIVEAPVEAVAIEPIFDEPRPIEAVVPIEVEFSPPSLPVGKEFFRIREVSDLLDLDPQRLRDWEDDFSMVRPTKAGGQRVYRRSDVETLSFLRHCLLVEKLGIDETRDRVKAWRKREKKVAAPAAPLLAGLAQDLRDLLRLAQSSPF